MRGRVDGHETVQAGLSWKFESVFAWLRVRVEFNCVFQPCTSRLNSAFEHCCDQFVV